MNLFGSALALALLTAPLGSAELEQPRLWWSIRPATARVSDDGSTFGVFVENGGIPLRVVFVVEGTEPVVITPAFWRALNVTGAWRGKPLVLQRTLQTRARILGETTADADLEQDVTVQPEHRIETELVLSGIDVPNGQQLDVQIAVPSEGLKKEDGSAWRGRIEASDQYRVDLRARLTADERLDFHVLKGFSALQAGAYTQAADEYRQALKVKSDDLEAMSGLGHALVRSGDYRGAVAILTQVRARLPSNRSPVLYLLAEAYVGVGDVENAKKTLEAVMPAERGAEYLDRLRSTMLRR